MLLVKSADVRPTEPALELGIKMIYPLFMLKLRSACSKAQSPVPVDYVNSRGFGSDVILN